MHSQVLDLCPQAGVPLLEVSEKQVLQYEALHSLKAGQQLRCKVRGFQTFGIMVETLPVRIFIFHE